MPGTNVIILAQGKQTRLPKLVQSKCLLPLPACGDATILKRTLTQVVRGIGTERVRDHNLEHVVVVSWLPVIEHLALHPIDLGDYRWIPAFDTLMDPGNSSLIGLWLHMSRRHDLMKYEKTVVLLADVVYSWDCLKALFTVPVGQVVAAGTHGITPSSGELWGIAWPRAEFGNVMNALAKLVDHHPNYPDYQPGQMRKLMWALHPHFHERDGYRPIDDYTRDIDLPEHVDMLPELSRAAAADDAKHGVTW